MAENNMDTRESLNLIRTEIERAVEPLEKAMTEMAKGLEKIAKYEVHLTKNNNDIQELYKRTSNLGRLEERSENLKTRQDENRAEQAELRVRISDLETSLAESNVKTNATWTGTGKVLAIVGGVIITSVLTFALTRT